MLQIMRTNTFKVLIDWLILLWFCSWYEYTYWSQFPESWLLMHSAIQIFANKISSPNSLYGNISGAILVRKFYCSNLSIAINGKSSAINVIVRSLISSARNRPIFQNVRMARSLHVNSNINIMRATTTQSIMLVSRRLLQSSKLAQ